MKLTKKCIAMLAALAVCIFCTGGIPSFSYYTYQISSYAEYPGAFVHSFVGYLAVFMVFACGFFGIYDIRRLALVFAAIQPVKLVIDLVSTVSGNYFPTLSRLMLTYMAIYFADLLIGNRSGFAATVKQNKKPLLIALAVSVAGGVIELIVNLIINTISIKVMSSAADLMKPAIVAIAISGAVAACLFVAAVLCLKAIFGKIYTPTAEGTSAAGTALTVAAIALIAMYTAYYLINLIQTYTSFFSEPTVW